MIRIQIEAAITNETNDVFALHPAVADAAEDEFVFTVGTESLLVNVAGPDLPAVLAVLAPSNALGQLTFYASDIDPLLVAA